MTSTIKTLYCAAAIAVLAACSPDSVFLNDGYEVVRTDGPTSYMLKASTGECIKKTSYQGGTGYQRVPTEEC